MNILFKLYYSKLMESFNMNNFLVWGCFNFKKYLCNCKNHKIWNHFIINQLMNPSRTISEWELSVTRCYLCYSLRFNCSSPSKSPCSTEHQTHAAIQTHVSTCAASSKSALRHWQSESVCNQMSNEKHVAIFRCNLRYCFAVDSFALYWYFRLCTFLVIFFTTSLSIL